MHFSKSVLGLLLAGGAFASPVMDIFPRGDVVTPQEGDIDFSKMFEGDTAPAPLEPVDDDDDNTSIAKRAAKKFDLKDQITLAWKNGAYCLCKRKTADPWSTANKPTQRTLLQS